jgi:hypothetical protein
MRAHRFASLALAALLFVPLAASHAAGERTVDQTDLVRALNGSPAYLGTISATTSAKNNADTTAFTIPAGSLLLIVPSAAVKILADDNATEDITTANGVPLIAGEKFYLLMTSTQTHLQAITDSSTSDVKVWRVR